MKTEYDAVVIGAGHAGVEAALALARTGNKTLMITLSLNSISFLACNPSIGGTAKGHLVREIDALGGQMGICADETALQLKLLNSSKGNAVKCLRSQTDKIMYHLKMKQTLENQENLTLLESEVSEILKFTMLYDLYARENLKSRPEWAQEILYRPFCEDFYRDETLTRQYLPSYSGCTSRQMKRMTHMEGFVMDIAETAKAGYRIGGSEALLFDYKERDPLTYAAKIVKVSVKS